MAELIENGIFETRDLSPWEWCTPTELGESWICLEDEDPGFPCTSRAYTREGGITDENWVFISEYNLALHERDGVVQHFPPGTRAGDDLTLWVTSGPIDRVWGDFYTFICYRDKTYNYTKVTPQMLFERSGAPYFLRMPVLDKTIEKIILLVDEANVWFVNAISLPGAEGTDKRGCSPFRFFMPDPGLEKRISFLENKVEKLQRLLVKRPFMIETRLKEEADKAKSKE